ncbi:MAG: DEAD/DEAH box helicase, partial [Bifidobacteriaceae bacterium]|nr:DEAD/DEAH box helicase [Bifidobacteriaceae bacterium]
MTEPVDAPAGGRSDGDPFAGYEDHATRSAKAAIWQFQASMAYPLDDYQLEACKALAGGEAVLVAAPTGAGKTTVALFGIERAIAAGQRAFYTTPIKALSNQKYRELGERFGADSVGLLTGDQSIRPDAPVVVMTTEVLRNMLYSDPARLDNLGLVVLDEVHYLADRYRGPVWEEVLIQLPGSVQVAALSATVSNADEFGEWLSLVRGPVRVVVSTTRPIPLWQQVLTHNGLMDLYAPSTAERATPQLNPDLILLDRFPRPPGGRPRSGGGRYGSRQPGRSRHNDAPRGSGRPGVVHELEHGGLLPAIYFVFSRAGCEAAADECRRLHLALTDAAEAERIETLIEQRAQLLDRTDLAVVGYRDFLEGAKAGFAPHHAGMLPVFKEAVEELFQAGLLKVVFATETLALGINMPARTVVIDRLDKWDGTAHTPLTPGEYTQLTGRAGRRGIDFEGHAVVVAGSRARPPQVLPLAAGRTYPLRSAFHPTYNMAVNLIRRLGKAKAGEVLDLSFAQFQADRAVAHLAGQVRQIDQTISAHQDAMVCDRGDFAEFQALRERLSGLEKAATKRRIAARKEHSAALAATIRRGDILGSELAGAAGKAGGATRLPRGDRPSGVKKGDLSGLMLVLHAGKAGAGRPTVLTDRGKVRKLILAQAGRLDLVTHIKVKGGEAAKTPDDRAALIRRMRNAATEAAAQASAGPGSEVAGQDAAAAKDWFGAT